MDLFEFNDDFIASVACGMSNDDVTELFARAIRAGADVLERRLISTAGPELASQATFVNGAFEIPLTEGQFDAEFGDGDEPPQANVRRAIISSTIQGSREMTKVLGGN